MPTVVAKSARPTPTAPAIFLFLGSISLSRKMSASRGRKAIIVIIAPSWFWTKNLNGSDRVAGSWRFDFFQRMLPAIAKTAMTTKRPIRRTKPPLSNVFFLSATIAAISVAMATNQEPPAIRRSFFALDFWSLLACHAWVTSISVSASPAFSVSLIFSPSLCRSPQPRLKVNQPRL